MKRNTLETILGAVVIIVAVGFLFFGYQSAEPAGSGYVLHANFSATGGLKPGDDVRISGSVSGLELETGSYLARVTMDVDSALKLPEDSSALISSDSLLGGRYLEIQPGAMEDTLENGGEIIYTQAPQNLEQLLGQFIFSVQDEKEENGDSTSSAAPSDAPPVAGDAQAS